MNVAEIFREDFKFSKSSFAEFPITAMSTDVAEAITGLAATGGFSINRALDVGTGSGLHAAAIAAAGAANILAIDISPPAVAAAKQRFGRILKELQMLVGTSVAVPKFEVCDMSGLESGQSFDLICTNPPSFFRRVHRDGPLRTPMDMALFGGESSNGHVAEKSFLYRFFADVIDRYLARDGILICGWPAIERRVADGNDGALVHPAVRLREWLGITLLGRVSDVERFFSKTAQVRSYGKDGGLLAQVYRDISATNLYSASVVMTDKTKLTFRYGVLAMRRLSADRYSLLEV